VSTTLSIADLAIDRGGRRVVEQLSFSATGGEAIVVTGPNGAGKTTLVRAIAGFLMPASGTITLDTGDADADRSIAERCHAIGHANGIKASLTVAENLDFSARFLDPGATNATYRERIDIALDRLALTRLADIPAGYLSAGQKRRVCLARLLVAHRPLWLLDEPTVSLDTASARRVAELIDGHVSGGGIAVVVTHLPLGLARSRDLALAPIMTGGA
jgi:heme exporter protein A